MALNIEDPETERLAAEVTEMTGESKAGAVRNALRERRDRLRLESGGRAERPDRDMRRWLEAEIWPLIPEEDRGGPPIPKEEIERLLGFGPEGY